ncbi:hypothetical protein QUA54_04860 [Microcoleus sp. MOSTC5]|uniref:hypothetical protein n=1 Tax=Microcoleus sp. MOSTC5 TaxID=3055378 RepID=UPI002FD4CDAE
MNVEQPETLVMIESIVYKSNGFAILRFELDKDSIAGYLGQNHNKRHKGIDVIDRVKL